MTILLCAIHTELSTLPPQNKINTNASLEDTLVYARVRRASSFLVSGERLQVLLIKRRELEAVKPLACAHGGCVGNSVQISPPPKEWFSRPARDAGNSCEASTVTVGIIQRRQARIELALFVCTPSPK